ncbi:MAG TPA: UvrD-helicase domain-containing protein [Longimicrobiales bacterium]|nr:UvrD-helicase domain-containing protein [Longimicrobiales bacterium]
MARRSDPDQLGLFEPAPESHPEPGATAERLPDQDARDRIERDLDSNLLVEAGAGSGKTTALVRRMVALVETGAARVDQVAAVTFTRKAAAELRERFQAELEQRLLGARGAGNQDRLQRLDRALREVDRAFIGTIHSFCARLLRERPVEASLDPGFRELMGAEEVRLRRGFWRDHLERLGAAGDPGLDDLVAVGLAPSALEGLFDEIVSNPDVTFDGAPADRPSDTDIAGVRRRLEELVDRALSLMPAEEPEKGWDKLQSRVRLLEYLRRVGAWKDRVGFLDLLAEEVHGRSCGVTQYKWSDGAAAKALSTEWDAFRKGAVDSVLSQWWAHRYPIAIRFAARAAEQFALDRRRTGQLNFQDLLMLAARLLREQPEARRELGNRYRRLLVDEFQDTDPVQAEVLMLLASEPDGSPWQEATPRDGALFVVGDPKQSIYRFRRADISIYNLVRQRFRDFGAVLELVANFRSGPPVGALVNAVFDDPNAFGPDATPHQAAFAPLLTREDRQPEDGIAWYEVEGGNKTALAADGAARLAPWIASQVADGRSPADFLVLARQRAGLARYARALEAWGVPVQVTGAGVNAELELRELMLLLEALEDPGDQVRTVAVLTGLFFGIDQDTLVAWALGETPPGGRRDFDFRHPPEDHTPVATALRKLHGWWRSAMAEPADMVVHAIVRDLGLLPFAAAEELGGLRAGGLAFALDALRVAALRGDTSIPAALDALRTALDSEEAEAALEPAREGVVRIMTLHQAKGLEAPVVILVHPTGNRDRDVSRHIDRADDGSAVGWLVIQERVGWQTRVQARPAGWEARAAEEGRYEAAEQVRLLYVAATRPEHQLVVERPTAKEDESPWVGLHQWLDQHGERLDLGREEPPERQRLERAPGEIQLAVEAAERRRQEAAEPGYRTEAVRERAHREAGSPAGDLFGVAGDTTAGQAVQARGMVWGSVVHGALEAAAAGATGDRLRSLCRSILLEEERPVVGGEPAELDELIALVESVRASALWQRAQNADRVLTEVPLALRRSEPAGGPAGIDEDGASGAAPVSVLEGIVDLAFREEDGWVVVDYKTDTAISPQRLAAYRRQVELYAEAWAAFTDEPVKERVLFLTSRPESSVAW